MATTGADVPIDQSNADDWFDLDKYRQAAGVAYEFSKKKAEDAGGQERETIDKLVGLDRSLALRLFV